MTKKRLGVVVASVGSLLVGYGVISEGDWAFVFTQLGTLFGF